jgi:hypothetical protein
MGFWGMPAARRCERSSEFNASTMRESDWDMLAFSNIPRHISEHAA